MLKKRRMLVVVLIIMVLIPIFTYAQMKSAQNTRKQLGTEDWHVAAQKKIRDYSNSLSNNIPEEFKKYRKVEIQKLQYALARDVDPQSPNAVTFTNILIRNTISLILPLFVTVVAADVVSSEHSNGTIKILLTRPVRRWKILMSKLITLLMFVSMIILVMAILSYLISGIVFGYKGWGAPVLTGYQISDSQLITDHVHIVSQAMYLVMELGLAWFSCAAVACLALMTSVLVRSTAASMGIMLATLIAGFILTNMVSSWESAKYLFVINLDTVSYLSGSIPPIPGLSLPFAIVDLALWAAGGLFVAFFVFTRKDILN
jgi:ABC-2 type transport system permease protein